MLAEKEDFDSAVTAYRSYLEVADLTERGEPVRELAVVFRKLDRDAEAYDFLEAEYRAGVRHPLMEKALGDLALGLMTVPNLIAILLLSGVVVKLTKEYLAREHKP